MTDQAARRIIDANFNRAREALRVMEEYARFVLDDAALSGSIKQTRHDLASAVDKLGYREGDPDARDALSDPLIAHRDIVGDVGQEVRTDSEYERANTTQVAVAAGKRLSEALRAVEEYGKAIDPTFAATIEQIRYRGYELERRLALTGRARERFASVRVYVLITESLCKQDWFETAKAALRGGADCLQLREKDLPDGELLARAKRLAKLCHEHDALMIVNDRPDIAALSSADGVHLGQDDVSVSAARRILPSNAIVGLSTHTVDQVNSAITQVADYIGIGPIFPSPTKPQDHIAGLETLAKAAKLTSLPLTAIGGITVRNAAQVVSTARCCLCVCSDVLIAADPAKAVSRLCAVFGPS